MLRKVDQDSLAEMLGGTERINWRLNIRRVDGETIFLLEQLDDAIKKLHGYLIELSSVAEDGDLRVQLNGLIYSKTVAALLDDLTKHHLAILGAEYLIWESSEEHVIHQDGAAGLLIEYYSTRSVVLSIEGHSTQTRRAKVWQGTVPPKYSEDQFSDIKVNGMLLPNVERDL